MNNVKRARRTPRRKPSQAAKFGISVPTFRRYIAALKKHLGECCGLRLRYDRAGKAYGIAER